MAVHMMLASIAERHQVKAEMMAMTRGWARRWSIPSHNAMEGPEEMRKMPTATRVTVV